MHKHTATHAEMHSAKDLLNCSQRVKSGYNLSLCLYVSELKMAI